jgi:hypothetical protein
MVASGAPLDGGSLLAARASLAPQLRVLASASAARLLPPLGGGEVYTDDRAPVEWLVDTSLISYATGR